MKMKTQLKKPAGGWPDMLNVTLGCWLFLSPFFLGHEEEMTSSLNAYVTGAFIAVIAGYARADYDVMEEVLVVLAALWLAISPWALGFAELTTAGTANAVVTGFAVTGLAAWSALSDHEPAAPAAA